MWDTIPASWYNLIWSVGEPITADIVTDFDAIGWCGRLDIAVKLAAGELARAYRDVRIYALDGTRVQ